MKKVLIGGTSKIFTSNRDVSQTMSEFFNSFPKDRFTFIGSGPSDFLVAFNHNPKLYRQFLGGGGSIDRAVLLRFEPDSVFPAQYTDRITRKYGLVISPGSSQSRIESEIQIGWPYEYHLNPAKPEFNDPALKDIIYTQMRAKLFVFENWESRGHLLTMVAGNKVSSIANANYSLRRSLVKSLPPNILEVYGPLWEGSLFQKIRHRLAVLVATIKQGTCPNLREIYGNLLSFYPAAKGSIIDKHALLQDSKFSLVIENSNSIVTEKIFDAIINGAIPIYVGPSLETVGLPSSLAFSVSGSSKEILEVLAKADSVVVRRHLSAMSTFIRSSIFWEHWEAGAVYRRMVSEIIQYLSKIDTCN